MMMIIQISTMMTMMMMTTTMMIVSHITYDNGNAGITYLSVTTTIRPAWLKQNTLVNAMFLIQC